MRRLVSMTEGRRGWVSRDVVHAARQLLSVSYQRFSRYVQVSVEQEPRVSAALQHLTWRSTLSALSSKASCLFCFPATAESYCSWQQLQNSLSLCLPLARIVLPCDILALSIKYAWTLEMKLILGMLTFKCSNMPSSAFVSNLEHVISLSAEALDYSSNIWPVINERHKEKTSININT